MRDLTQGVSAGGQIVLRRFGYGFTLQVEQCQIFQMRHYNHAASQTIIACRPAGTDYAVDSHDRAVSPRV